MLIALAFILFSFSFISASTGCPSNVYPCNPSVQFNNPTPINPTSSNINYSTVNVNNSLFLNGHSDTYFYPYYNPLGFFNSSNYLSYNSTYDAKVSFNSTNVCWLNETNQNLTLYNLSVTNLTVNGWNIVHGANPIFYTNTNLNIATNSTFKNVGLGVYLNMTPLTSGKIRFHLDATTTFSGTTNGYSFRLVYGTGTPPPFNVSYNNGTVVGTVASLSGLIVGSQIDVWSRDVLVIGLTKGTNYWFDLQCSTTSLSGLIVCPIANLETSLEELPY